MHELPIDLVAEKRNFESVAVGDAKLFAYDHAPCRQLLLLDLNQGLGFRAYGRRLLLLDLNQGLGFHS